MYKVGCPRSETLAGLLLAAGMLFVTAEGVAQPSEVPVDRDDGAAETGGAVAAQGDAAESDEAFVPDDTPGLTPMASYVVRDEITVRGTRPGEIRAQLWNLDTQIERTINDFYKMLNDIVVDEQFHVICEWGGATIAPGVDSRIRQRFCFTGYQVEELRTKRDFERDGGVYEPDQAWLAKKEEEFAEVVFAAMEAYPALVVAAENLVRMHEERAALTGGDPAMSLAQLDRQRARQAVRGQADRREQRRQREAERAAELGAR